VARFDVHAFPTLLTLGDQDEKIHRFSGFQKPDAFTASLEDALARYALYRAGKEWDEPEPRAPSITSEGTVELMPAPSEEVPNGLAFLGDLLYVAQGATLFRVDPATGAVQAKHELPASVRDLCSDGTRLYAMEYGWTAGKPIHVVDPKTGRVLRSIVTEANAKNKAFGAAGVAWRDGRLWVLEGMQGRIHEVDPETGAVRRTVQTERRWLTGLAWDGDAFVAGSRDALLLLDPETGAVRREVKTHYPLRALAAHGGRVLLMEQPVFGHDKDHRRVRIWPKQTFVHVLTLAPR